MPTFLCHIDPEASDALSCIAIRAEGALKKEVADILGKPNKEGLYLLPYRKSIDFLNEVTRSGALYFQGKEIVVDIYGTVDFSFRVEASSEVFGWITYKGKEWYFHECSFISPYFVIFGCSLKLLDTDVSWKKLKATYEKKLSLEEVEDAEVVYVGGAEELHLPVLKLTDRSGAFANLYLDNGKPDGERIWEADLLETDFIKKRVGSSDYYCQTDKVAKSLCFLLELGWTVLDDKQRPIYPPKEVAIHLEECAGGAIIKANVCYQNQEVELENADGLFFDLPEGGVGLLSDEVKAKVQPIFDEGERTSSGLFMRNVHLLAVPDIDLPPSLKKRSLTPPTEGFKAVLRPYQQEGVNWLAFLYENSFHGLLADEMGLGKTVQVLAFLSRLKRNGLPSLIVMPTSLLFNWKCEAKRFLPDLDVALYTGKETVKDHQVVLISYAKLRLDAESLSNEHFECVILDEAQAIKNANTQTAKAACALSAQFRLLVTGTPIENSLSELWSHFHFLMPDLLGELPPIADEHYLKRVRKNIRPFLMRRTKDEVARDLPEKIEQDVWVEMDGNQRALYDAFRGKLAQGTKREIFEKILRLRQVCCHPLLCDSSEETPRSAKLDVLFSDLETLVSENHKVLIYSQFTSLLSLIAKEIKERKWKFGYLDGQTKNREEVVATFQEDPDLLLFLISLKAGGVGLNLTAADYVLLLDPWWNEAVENQAINRAHRMGRKDVVIAKRYLIRDSIEEKMQELKKRKTKVSSQIIDDQSIENHLTEEDFDYLLS